MLAQDVKLAKLMDGRYPYFITQKSFGYYRLMHGFQQIFKHEDREVCEKLLRILEEKEDE
jgi:hypothetical protein